MDARDLFKRLSAGAKFDTNRFKNDALKFKVFALFSSVNITEIDQVMTIFI